MITVRATPVQAIRLGYLGENERMRVAFSIASDIAEFPGASFTLLNQGPEDSAAYPCAAVDVIGDTLYWTITSAELRAAGKGRCQIVVTVDGIIAKHRIYETEILTALDGSGEVPPDWESWQGVFAAIKDEAESAAEAAEAASQAVQDMAVESTTLQPGTPISVTKRVGEHGEVTLAFGLAQGERGERGPKGDTGPQGVKGDTGDPWYESIRVTSLDSTQLAIGTVIEVIGTPVYVKNIATYSEYGITQTGWYVFARINAKDGVRVTSNTTITGAAGQIVTVGASYVDVAVRFGTTAESQTVVVNWGESQETFVFKAGDLAVRNLDYRTTFYIYDVTQYATWTYALTTDATFVTNKNYYTKDGDEYTLSEVTAGEAVPADTYYNHSKLHFEGMVANVTYRLEEIVDCPIEIVLPAVAEDGHGAWFEIQMRYNDSYSCTLLPPEGVKIGTAQTQPQTAGVNTIDLQYTDAGDVKMWTLLNTHSNIPA